MSYSLSSRFTVTPALFSTLRSKFLSLGSFPPNSLILLQGGDQACREDTDHEEVFRQESHMAGLFGVREPSVCGAIHTDTGNAYLLVPHLPESYEIWCGPRPTLQHYSTMYGVAETLWIDELEGLTQRLGITQILTLGEGGINGDSGVPHRGVTLPLPKGLTVDRSLLFEPLCHARAYKTGPIADLMRAVAQVSAEAHTEVMRIAKPGMREYELEAKFMHYTYANAGCRHTSYTSICGCGINGATLHYGHAGAPNDYILKDGDMVLLDMGGELHFHGADISRSYPVNGKFTPDQRAIYETVLAAADATIAGSKPGVSYVALHELALRTILEGLRDRVGILRKDADIEAAFAAGVGQVFMPHGLGHMLGIDTHDVWGGERDPRYPTLRLTRVLEEHFCITIEPGCYFIKSLLDDALKNDKIAAFLDADRLEQFRTFGGVRIEDDLLITATGAENMSSAAPRTVEAIEAIMAEASNKRKREA